MGEWSDYFEDFPEENPANWMGNNFDPEGAKRARELDAKAEIASAEIKKMLADAWIAEKGRSLFVIESCPQCGKNELHTYHIKEKYFLSECHDCGTYGKGTSHAQALKDIENAFGEGLDWRDNPNPWSR